MRKEAKLEKEEADKYARLQVDLADAQIELMLFKLFHSQKQIDELAKDLEAKSKVCISAFSMTGVLKAAH